MIRSRRLPRTFYARDTLSVARDLLGCILVHESAEGRTSGRIVEVEAYHGEDDPACHAAAGRTRRTDPLYGPAGFSYVYLIYGMHCCLNAVTRDEGQPSAVLIRAVEPLEGQELMLRRRTKRRLPADRELTSGPGKLCEAFALTRDHNRLDLSGSKLWIEAGDRSGEPVWTPRIGIRVGEDRFWRCFDAGSEFVSRSPLNRIAAGGT